MSNELTDTVPPAVLSPPIPTGAITLGPMSIVTTRDERRFRAAVAAMQAIIAKVSAIEVRTDGDRARCKQIVDGARLYADELMTELERTKP